MADEQLFVRLAEEEMVYPTVVSWKVTTVGLPVRWQVAEPFAGTVTVCPLTVMVWDVSCS